MTSEEEQKILEGISTITYRYACSGCFTEAVESRAKLALRAVGLDSYVVIYPGSIHERRYFLPKFFLLDFRERLL